MRYLRPLGLYEQAKREAKNILGFRFGKNRSGICVWKVDEETIEPLQSTVDCDSHGNFILDHTKYSVAAISKQVQSIAVEQKAIGYLSGFPDDRYYRGGPMNGFIVKQRLLELDASNDHSRMFISLISDRNSTKVVDRLFSLAFWGRVSAEDLDIRIKNTAAMIITGRLERLAVGGEAFRAANFREYMAYEDSQRFMDTVGRELGF